MFDESQMLQVFRLIDARGASGGALPVLRRRLVGELLGDAEGVAATLAADFELVSHTGTPATTTPGDELVESIRRQGEAGTLLWVELDHLVAEGDTVAGEGLLRMYRPDQGAVTTMPLAIFVRVAGERMTREVAFMDAGAADTTVVDPATMPTADQLRTALEAVTGLPSAP